MLRGYSGLGEQSLKEIAYGILLSWNFDEKRGLWKWFINFHFFCTTVAPKVFIDDNISSLLGVIYPLKHGQRYGLASVRVFETETRKVHARANARVDSASTEATRDTRG